MGTDYMVKEQGLLYLVTCIVMEMKTHFLIVVGMHHQLLQEHVPVTRMI